MASALCGGAIGKPDFGFPRARIRDIEPSVQGSASTDLPPVLEYIVLFALSNSTTVWARLRLIPFISLKYFSAPKEPAGRLLPTDVEVARECCEWSDRRMSLMQPKWFRRLDVAVGHAVWVADGVQVPGGFVRAIDNDGHYTAQSDAAGAALRDVRRENLCLKWQVGSNLGAAAAAVSPDVDVDDGRRRRSNGVADGEGEGSRPTAVPTPENVKRLAAMDCSRVDGTVLLFRRGEAGRRCRARAVKGELMDDDITQLPSCFHELLDDLKSPVSGRTGATVQSSDFANMLDDLGVPRLITVAIMRRKLGKIAKGKAPGFSGNGPDLHAPLPDCWVEWAVELANIIKRRRRVLRRRTRQAALDKPRVHDGQ